MNKLLSARLKEARTLRNLKQSDVAAIIGVKKNTISNYENEKSTPDIDTLVELCNIYKINCAELLESCYSENQENISVLQPVIKQDPLLVAYDKLNITGKEEAIKRVEELTEIARYTQDERQSKLNA